MITVLDIEKLNQKSQSYNRVYVPLFKFELKTFKNFIVPFFKFSVVNMGSDAMSKFENQIFSNKQHTEFEILLYCRQSSSLVIVYMGVLFVLVTIKC